MTEPAFDPIGESLIVAADAADGARAILSVATDERLRISYLPGPGDVEGTFRHWRKRAFDPRVPSVAYSTMFFELCRRLDADAQIVQRDPERSDASRFEAVEIARIPFSPGNGSLQYLANRSAYARSCVDAVNRFDPHLVIVSSDFVWRAFPALTRGRKSILTVHNSLWPIDETAHPLKRRLKLSALSRWLRSIDGAVFTSHACARQINALAGGRFPELVAAPQQKSPPETVASPNSRREIVYLGRIERNKGVFDLVDAFERIAPHQPSARLVFIGDGGASADLEARVAASSAKSGIDLRGRLDADAVHDALSRATLLVCPTQRSFDEGLAFVCFEAAAHGVPSVMTTVVPAKDLLAGACVVVQPEAPIALADAINGLLSDDARLDALRSAVRDKSALLYDRAQSWGSQVWRAIESL
ncbi:MAG: glycosyltransferase family 4 protein [Pseudomonadota bacterium]